MSINTHFEIEDDFVNGFLSTSCEIGDDLSCPFWKIYNAFLDYCQGKIPGKFFPSMKCISLEMKKRFRRQKEENIYVFHGLRVRDGLPLPDSTMATMVRGFQEKGEAGSGQSGRGFAAAASTMRGFSGGL